MVVFILLPRSPGHSTGHDDSFNVSFGQLPHGAVRLLTRGVRTDVHDDELVMVDRERRKHRTCGLAKRLAHIGLVSEDPDLYDEYASSTVRPVENADRRRYGSSWCRTDARARRPRRKSVSA